VHASAGTSEGARGRSLPFRDLLCRHRVLAVRAQPLLPAGGLAHHAVPATPGARLHVACGLDRMDGRRLDRPRPVGHSEAPFRYSFQSLTRARRFRTVGLASISVCSFGVGLRTAMSPEANVKTPTSAHATQT